MGRLRYLRIWYSVTSIRVLQAASVESDANLQNSAGSCWTRTIAGDRRGARGRHLPTKWIEPPSGPRCTR